jgi:hypothetical protein
MTAPLILIGLGIAFLLHNFGMLSFEFLRLWWPMILIILGLSIMYQRLRR